MLKHAVRFNALVSLLLISSALWCRAEVNVQLYNYPDCPCGDMGEYSISLQATGRLGANAEYVIQITNTRNGSGGHSGVIHVQTNVNGEVYSAYFGGGPDTNFQAGEGTYDELRVTGVTRVNGPVDIRASGLASFVSSNVSGLLPSGFTRTVGNSMVITLSPLRQNTDALKPNDLKVESCSSAAEGPTHSTGMAKYDVHAMRVSLNITDTPFRYTPLVGPAVDFTVTYNEKDTEQPASFTYSNFGRRWTLNWISYVTDNAAQQESATSVYLLGGGVEVFAYDSATQTFSTDRESHARLVRTSTNPITYERRMPDGSKFVYAQSDNSYPRRVFLTELFDPAGNKVTINYVSGTTKIASVTDALGYTTTLSYELVGDPLKITKITEPTQFGTRVVEFTYTNGQLTKIKDPVGIESQFTYAAGTDTINSMSTPYGTTSFSSGQSGTNTWINITDPEGHTERIEYRDNAPGISATETVAPNLTGLANSGLNFANTFHWDEKALEMHPPVNGVYDYTKARITHWLLNLDGTPSGSPHTKKAPLENRVWHTCEGQTSGGNYVGSNANPSATGRVLDDGTTTQRWLYEYNSIGKLTKSTDPVDRVTRYEYAVNKIDLTAVFQQNGAGEDKLAAYSYDDPDAPRKPSSATDAAGQTTTYTYNAGGQVETITNAKNETTTYAYGGSVPAGYLRSITGPQVGGSSPSTSFTYDGSKPRVRTVTTQPDNYVVTTDYDALDRPAQITYSDSPQTNRQFQYTQDFGDGRGVQKLLDVTKTIDRRGRETIRRYNKNRQLDAVTEPFESGQTRMTTYDWCSCGQLDSITDARGKTTSFIRDLQGRVTSKVFADNTAISYVYENTTSRLKSMTDPHPLNQITGYTYFKDNNLQQITYTNELRTTPDVSFTYDPVYDRVASMNDGSATAYT